MMGKQLGGVVLGGSGSCSVVGQYTVLKLTVLCSTVDTVLSSSRRPSGIRTLPTKTILPNLQTCRYNDDLLWFSIEIQSIYT